MSQEDVPSSARQLEAEPTDQETIEFRAHNIRISAKDILLDTSEAPVSFPNRARLTQLANEILALVPIYDQAREAAEDRARAESDESQRSARQIWNNRSK